MTDHQAGRYVDNKTGEIAVETKRYTKVLEKVSIAL